MGKRVYTLPVAVKIVRTFWRSTHDTDAFIKFTPYFKVNTVYSNLFIYGNKRSLGTYTCDLDFKAIPMLPCLLSGYIDVRIPQYFSSIILQVKPLLWRGYWHLVPPVKKVNILQRQILHHNVHRLINKLTKFNCYSSIDSRWLLTLVDTPHTFSVHFGKKINTGL